jgi:hypothetical protein
VAAITEKLCGAKIGASQVSWSSQLLDEELKIWSDRSWGEIVYLYLDAYYEKVVTDRLLDQIVQQEMKKFRLGGYICDECPSHIMYDFELLGKTVMQKWITRINGIRLLRWQPAKHGNKCTVASQKRLKNLEIHLN